MYMNAAHIRENILSEAEARAQGMPVGENINYHALGKELFLKAVDAMDGPIEVFQWRKNPYNHYGPNDYLVITQVTDQGWKSRSCAYRYQLDRKRKPYVYRRQ